jgi:DNA-binding transcriptional regulator YiaG
MHAWERALTVAAWTAADVRAARERLGLSAAKFAELLGLEKNGVRTVQRWESGDIRITPRTQRQIEALLREHKPGYSFVGQGSITNAKIIKPDH